MNPHNTKNSSMKLRLQATLLKCLALCAALPVATGALAANKSETGFEDDARWFQVELILFSHRADLALDAEQWPSIEGLNLPEELLELYLPQPEVASEDPLAATDESTPVEAASEAIANAEEPGLDMAAETEESSDLPVAYQILPDEQLQLTDVAAQLQRSAGREMLLHVSWQQPTYDRKNAVPIYFSAGMTDPLPVIEDEGENETAVDGRQSAVTEMLPAPGEDTLMPMLEYATEEDLKIGPTDPQFVGTVTLSVERYLHVATDLIYRQAITQHNAIPIPDLDLWYDRPYPTLREPQGPAFQQMEWQAVRGFQLKESRRMRSTEIHYLDNPFMGMVVVITPVELPEPAEEIQQTSPQNILLTPSRVRKPR